MRASAFPTVASALLLLCACEHKDVCFDHDDHAYTLKVNLQADYELEWEYTYDDGSGRSRDWSEEWPTSFRMTYSSLSPTKPEGLRAVVYNEDHSHNILNLEPEGGEMLLRPGHHSILLYNNDTEYIVFDGLDEYATASATTRGRMRTTYKGFSKGREENTVNPPDVLFGHYIDDYESVRTPEPDLLPVKMRPLVFTYVVHCEISKGLEHVVLARGALSGMAASVYLNSGTTSPDEVTLLYDCTIEDFGAQAIVRSFGVPDFPNEHYSRTDRFYGLNLEVRLRNGNIVNFNCDVSDQVSAQPRGGIIIVKGLEIPESASASTGSGFNAEVTDWGDVQDIPIGF